MPFANRTRYTQEDSQGRGQKCCEEWGDVTSAWRHVIFGVTNLIEWYISFNKTWGPRTPATHCDFHHLSFSILQDLSRFVGIKLLEIISHCALLRMLNAYLGWIIFCRAIKSYGWVSHVRLQAWILIKYLIIVYRTSRIVYIHNGRAASKQATIDQYPNIQSVLYRYRKNNRNLQASATGVTVGNRIISLLIFNLITICRFAHEQINIVIVNCHQTLNKTYSIKRGRIFRIELHFCAGNTPLSNISGMCCRRKKARYER